MALRMNLHGLTPTSINKKLLAKSMTGASTAFAPPTPQVAQPLQAPFSAQVQTPVQAPMQAQAPAAPSLQPNFGFGDLANYDEQKRNQFSTDVQKQLADRRAQLATSLNNQGSQLFQQQEPGILEDLHRRGLDTSTSEVNNSNATALKSIALDNNKYLNNFDDSATGVGLQTQQDALNSGLDLRKSELETRLTGQNADREEQLARDLAKQQSRNGLTNSLVGAGSSLLGQGLGKGGFLSGLFGVGGSGGGGLFSGGGAAAPGFGVEGGQIGPAAAPGGIGLGGAAAIGGAGLGAMALADQGQKVAGTPGAFLANPIGAQLNIAKKGISSVANVFCFDGRTPVTMADGSQKPIMDVGLTEETKGGTVLSIRASVCANGDLYDYLDTLVTGTHAVFENGAWIRVGTSPYAKAVQGQAIVYSLVTSHHRIHVGEIEFADEYETDDYEILDLDEALVALNKGSVGVN